MLHRDPLIQGLGRKLRAESVMRASLGLIVMFGSIGGVAAAWGEGLSGDIGLVIMLTGALVGAWLIGGTNVPSRSRQGRSAQEYRR